MTTELKCLEEYTKGADCVGEVEYRESLSGTGTPIARCDLHWDKRLEWQEAYNRIYPDSSVAPSWFDPSAAGESWDEE